MLSICKTPVRVNHLCMIVGIEINGRRLVDNGVGLNRLLKSRIDMTVGDGKTDEVCFGRADGQIKMNIDGKLGSFLNQKIKGCLGDYLKAPGRWAQLESYAWSGQIDLEHFHVDRSREIRLGHGSTD